MRASRFCKFMRLLLAAAAFGGFTGAASASTVPAGFEQLKVPDAGSAPAIDVAVWFPTDAASKATDFGPFTMTVAPRGSKVAGAKLPLVLISHGTGGSLFSHHDTAQALAEAGFVVAAVMHPGDNYADQSRAAAILERPVHLSRAIDHLLTRWHAREQLDASRIGAMGFSAGGFTVLALGGGEADLRRVGPYCKEHRRHFVCGVVARDPEFAASAAAGVPPKVRDPRVRAIVSAAPALGFAFTTESLAVLTVPVQLWRAEADEVLPHPWYAEAVRAGLPKSTDYREVPNAGHFDFLAPCTERFTRMAPPLCSSREGFDRMAFHAAFNEALVTFFRRHLAG